MASVELKGISKRFGAVEVIRNLDLTVADGSFCALLGPSGCGKSTLLRMIAGLEQVSEGNIQIGGTDVTFLPPAQRRVAMVFQSYALYPHLTVRGNICFSMSLAGMKKADQNERADKVAKLLQLEQLMDRRPGAALRRPAPARRHRPGAGARPGSVPVRRAAVQSRRAAAECRCGWSWPSCI